MKSKTKIIRGETLDEEYKAKDYLNYMTVDRARTKYRERYFMLKYCKVNFLNDPVFKKAQYRCSFCPAISSQSHLSVCQRYEEIRRYRNLDDENDAIDFIIDVMKLNHDDNSEENEEDEVGQEA